MEEVGTAFSAQGLFLVFEWLMPGMAAAASCEDLRVEELIAP